MRHEEKLFVVRYPVFEVGELVCPSSPRCPLDDGVYTVTEYRPPEHPGDEPIVFVDGRSTGIDATYLTVVEATPEEKPNGIEVDVFLDSGIRVYMPKGTNIETPEGYGLAKQLAKEQFLKMLATDDFDIDFWDDEEDDDDDPWENEDFDEELLDEELP